MLGPASMILHGYFRSGAAWRLRIALGLKGLSFEQRTIDLRTGAQRAPEWLARNPQGLVPALELDDGTFLTQSLAILEWLEERYPDPPLLPAGPEARAAVRAVALVIAADTHPVQNLGVLKRIEAVASADAAARWAHDTIAAGLTAVEALLPRTVGPHAFGPDLTLADVVIVPQLLNARRFKVDLEPFARIRAVEAAVADHPAFRAARPEAQPDAD